jgi:hypothetical protein
VRKGTTRGLAARLLEDLSLKMSQSSFTDSIAATICVESLEEKGTKQQTVDKNMALLSTAAVAYLNRRLLPFQNK